MEALKLIVGILLLINVAVLQRSHSQISDFKLKTRYFQNDTLSCIMTDTRHLPDGPYALIECEVPNANESIDLPTSDQHHHTDTVKDTICVYHRNTGRCTHKFVRINSPPATNTNLRIFHSDTLLNVLSMVTITIDAASDDEEATTSPPVTCASSPTTQLVDNNSTDGEETTGDGNSTTVAMETATASTTESTESTTETHTNSQTTRSTDAPLTNGITDATSSVIANAGQSNRQNGSCSVEVLTQHPGFVVIVAVSVAFVICLAVMGVVLVATCWHFKKKMQLTTKPRPADFVIERFPRRFTI